MNTETKVHEYNMKKEKYDIYRKAYNAGKSDAIKEFVEMVRKDIKKLPHEMGFISRDDISTILTKRMDEVLKKQISKILEEGVISNTNTSVSCKTCKYHTDYGVCDLGFMCINNSGWVAKEITDDSRIRQW